MFGSLETNMKRTWLQLGVTKSVSVGKSYTPWPCHLRQKPTQAHAQVGKDAYDKNPPETVSGGFRIFRDVGKRCASVSPSGRSYALTRHARFCVATPQRCSPSRHASCVHSRCRLSVADPRPSGQPAGVAAAQHERCRASLCSTCGRQAQVSPFQARPGPVTTPT